MIWLPTQKQKHPNRVGPGVCMQKLAILYSCVRERLVTRQVLSFFVAVASLYSPAAKFSKVTAVAVEPVTVFSVFVPVESMRVTSLVFEESVLQAFTVKVPVPVTVNAI